MQSPLHMSSVAVAASVDSNDSSVVSGEVDQDGSPAVEGTTVAVPASQTIIIVGGGVFEVKEPTPKTTATAKATSPTQAFEAHPPSTAAAGPNPEVRGPSAPLGPPSGTSLPLSSLRPSLGPRGSSP